MFRQTRAVLLCLIAACLLPVAGYVQDYPGCGYEPTADDHLGGKEYSPHPGSGYPQRVFRGDTHAHTAFSTDAGVIGNRLGPEAAYRFARGEMVVASNGVRARPQRSLDFLVLADHAENLGLAPMIAGRNPDLLMPDFGRTIAGLV